MNIYCALICRPILLQYLTVNNIVLSMAVLVLELVVCDIEDDHLRSAIHCVVQWYICSRKESFTAEDVRELKEAAMNAVAAMRVAFAESGVHELELPKIHRLGHVANSVASFGPFNDLTTETSESKHKDFKKMFRWYVYARVRNKFKKFYYFSFNCISCHCIACIIEH